MGRALAAKMVCSRVVAGLFVLAACAVALPENPGLSTLDNVPSPNVRMSIAELDKVDAVPSVKEMERMIMKETDAPSKAVEDADDDAEPQSYAADVQQEEVAIGNTLRTMEAKEAVKEELKAEVPVDCQLGEWSTWTKCSRRCGGGKKSRMRSVLKHPLNGGTKCGALATRVGCNTTPCAVQEEQNYEQSRKLTRREHAKESIANNDMINLAMDSQDTSTMWSRIQGVMKNLVKTETAIVKVPGTDPEKYEVEQVLRKAMAKNAMAEAMSNVNIPDAPEPTQEQIEATKAGYDPDEAGSANPQ